MRAAFFDIDGTLMTNKGVIPQSTKDAVRMFQEKGGLAFICTGRTRVNIYPQVLDMNFDGVISGCGTMIEFHDDVLQYYEVPEDLALKTVEAAYKYNLSIILEGRYNLYFDEDENNLYPKEPRIILEHDIPNNLLPIHEHWGKWIFSKSVFLANSLASKSNRSNFFDELSEYYDVLIQTPFRIRGERVDVFELVPDGFSKGRAIRTLCRKIGLDIDNTYAFGDSVNDTEMLNSAGVGVVMGNGSSAAKEYADYVTDDINSNGIFNALKHFELI